MVTVLKVVSVDHVSQFARQVDEAGSRTLFLGSAPFDEELHYVSKTALK